MDFVVVVVVVVVTSGFVSQMQPMIFLNLVINEMNCTIIIGKHLI